jgi:hypothetical protein
MDPMDNVFDPKFLGLLERADEFGGAGHEAELAGPWKVVEMEGAYGLFETWQDPERGDAPLGAFEEKAVALRFLAAASAASRGPLFELGPRGERGFPVISNRRTEGHLNISEDRMLEMAHMADFCARWPPALAALLLSAGSVALRKAGAIVARALREEAGEGDR